MSFDLTEIGAFQFDNLVRNRIPFLLLHDGVEFQKIYSVVEKSHLDRWSQQVDFSAKAEALLKSLADHLWPKTLPVLLLSQKGEQINNWVPVLESAGYPNVHCVTGGWQAVIEAHSGE